MPAVYNRLKWCHWRALVIIGSQQATTFLNAKSNQICHFYHEYEKQMVKIILNFKFCVTKVLDSELGSFMVRHHEHAEKTAELPS